jgi:hypothetical protein
LLLLLVFPKNVNVFIVLVPAIKLKTGNKKNVTVTNFRDGKKHEQ